MHNNSRTGPKYFSSLADLLWICAFGLRTAVVIERPSCVGWTYKSIQFIRNWKCFCYIWGIYKMEADIWSILKSTHSSDLLLISFNHMEPISIIVREIAWRTIRITGESETMAQVSPVGHVATAEEAGQAAKVNGSGALTDLDQSSSYYRKEDMPTAAYNGLMPESEVGLMLYCCNPRGLYRALGV